MVAPLLETGVDKRVIDVFNPPNKDYGYLYAGLGLVQTIPLVHDVPNCGYSIMLWGKTEKEKLFYATDTGTLDGIEAQGYDYYFVEANHTTADIEARAEEKRERGEFAYEYRAAANHLSYEQAMDWLYKNMGATSKYILLHGHEERKEDADKI